MNIKLKASVTLFLIALSVKAQTGFTICGLFSDGAVIQRDKPVPVWGWSRPGSKIKIDFNGKAYSGLTDKDSLWKIILPAQKTGGPHVFRVSSGKESIEIKDLYFGEVWIASGQSNMEWRLSQPINNGPAEIAKANFPQIRFCDIKNEFDVKPRKKPSFNWDQKWKVCNPQNAGSFSAVAYFFAKKIYEDYRIPVGIITCEWGGTRVEAWTSREKLATTKLVDNELKKTDSKADLAALKAQFVKESTDWWNLFRQNDEGNKPENGKFWWQPDFDDSKWATIKAPGSWESQGYMDADGIGWYRKTIQLDADKVVKESRIQLGTVDDMDSVWINGIKVGGLDYYSRNRNYTLKPGILKAGANTIVVRVTDHGGSGGFTGDASSMFLKFGDEEFSLAGEWKFKISVTTKKLPPYPASQINQNTVAALFNGMLNPIIGYGIQGVIWYQGESNAGNAYAYRTLFPAMIEDWRERWGQGNFPFIYAQLANYKKPTDKPVESDWAELREAQTLTLEKPNTAMACIIDIGEAQDIHPKNKQDVGLRLAMAASKLVYGNNDQGLYSPKMKKATIAGNTIVIEVDGYGSSLSAKGKYGYINGFAIAGENQVWYWAQAKFDENYNIVVSSPNVPKPVAVRYGWANNPDDLNLYNHKGLPLIPFRTDNWKLSTQ